MPKTRSVGKYLERKADNWMVYRDIPKDVRKAIGKSRFKKSLHTTSMAVAEDRKGDWLKLWQFQIDMARGKVSLDGKDPDELIASATKLVEAAEYAGATPEQSFVELAFRLDPRGQPFEKQKELAQVHSKAMGIDRQTPTPKFIDEFFDQAQYAPEVGIEGKRYMVDVFTKKFPIFELISTEELAVYCHGRLNGSDGKNAWAKTTLRKNLNFAKQYWDYCLKVHTSAPNLINYDLILPKTIKTKAARLKTQNSNLPYSMKQIYEILDAAVEQAERTNKQGDHNLVDLIRLGMYTGCRIEEICNMKVADILPEAFHIPTAKTPSGERFIPMHKDVKQVVERLKQSSFDGYLLPGESNDNETDKRGKGLGSRFRRLQRKLGIPANKEYTFHSYRSTLAQRFESAGVEEILAARIIGHKVNSMTYGVYSQGADWPVLFNTMNDYITFPRPEDSNAE